MARLWHAPGGAVGRAVESRLRRPPRIGASSLVVSIRSGDVFSAAPHPSYAQPPLAFYIAVVEEEAPDAVVIVCEDDANPVIPALRHELALRRIPVRMQSADLRTDLGWLLAAERLVVARGTFGWAVALLNRRATRIHHFLEARIPRTSADPRLIGHEDADGAYRRALIADRGWSNSFEQRQLMLGYPRGAIARMACSRVIQSRANMHAG